MLRGFGSNLKSFVTSAADSSGSRSSPPRGAEGLGTRFAPPTITAKVVGHEMNSHGYTEYLVTVCFGKERWQVKRRYSRFFDLHSELGYEVSNSVFAFVSLPAMPPKRMCGSKSPSFVDRRADSLGEYLEGLLQDERVSNSRLVRNFLSPLPPDVVSLFWSLHFPLLKQGAAFNKLGTLFTRDVFIQLSEDNTVLEYWSPSEDSRAEAQDVKFVHIASIFDCRPSANGSSIVVDAEREVRLDSHEVGLKHQWLRALQALRAGAHLCCPATSLAGTVPKSYAGQQAAPRQSHGFKASNRREPLKPYRDGGGTSRRQSHGRKNRSESKEERRRNAAAKYAQYKNMNRISRERKENMRNRW